VVRLSEMDSGSIVFAGRTGRGGKVAGGVTRKARVGEGRAVSAMSRWEGGKWRWEGRGWWRWREKDLRFLREIFLRKVAESGR